MSAPALSANEFTAFFNAVWGYEPFPWQGRLLERVAAQGWPDLLDLPTGSGKTAAIDVAVFHLALEADKGPERTAAMRVAFVVDRRLVVDEAFQRARRLADVLADAACATDSEPGVVQRVALRLKHLAGEGEPPLVARQLRGGVPREDDWARTPCQPTVLCSTVDQVGSRLLFRGYGVSDAMKPVHAGLLGSDVLILLDEAHLSEPFRQTARDIAKVGVLRGADAAPFHVALLTATPGGEDDVGAPLRLEADDRAHPVLSRRLHANKPATLKEVGGTEEERGKALADAASSMLLRLKEDGVAAPALGVVANRIARARAAFDQLRTELGETAQVILLIGRARSVDREDLADALKPIKTGAGPRPTKPLIVVATQTIEAGVDIDLDGLVTEAASLDALRQRFGRLNRDGRAVSARGLVLFDRNDRTGKKPDPVYGAAISATLAALESVADGGEIDFGIEALTGRLEHAGLTGDRLLPLLSDKPDAPVLMPAYVDLWTHTSPIPACDPDAALFLHGPRREPAGVQLVWRADIVPAWEGEEREKADARTRALLSLAPPRAAEAIELPIWAARRWLAEGRVSELADVVELRPENRGPGDGRPAFRWRGADDERSRWTRPDGVAPGDTLVIPSDYGGCDAYGWTGAVVGDVRDVFDAASAPFAGRRCVVRVAPGLIRQAVAAEAGDPEEADSTRRECIEARVERIVDDVRARLGQSDAGRHAGALASDLAEIVPEPLKGALQRLAQARRGRIERPAFPYDGQEDAKTGVVFVAPFGLKGSGGAGFVSGTEDDEVGSFTGAPQSLKDHSEDVKAWAGRLAKGAGLPPETAQDLALAGWLHDAGKADPRFQRLLYDGDLLKMHANGPRAKSARGRSEPGAWERAGLPDRWRHEALSVRLALANARLADAHDRALVLWLVGTHHGRGRPFFPHTDRADKAERALAEVQGLAPRALAAGEGPQSLGFVLEGDGFGPTERDPRDLRGLDWATLFRELKARYGPWGLARLEAVLRLADHRASESARERQASDDEGRA